MKKTPMPMRTLPSLLLFAPLLWLAPLALVACGDDDAPATDAQRADMRRQVDLQDMDRIDSSDPLDSGEAADEGALDQSLSDVRDAERDRGAEEEDRGVERDQGDEEMSQEGALYVGSGDVFAPGALAVTSSALKITELDVTLWAPQQAGRYAVVVFQHGFLMSASYYASLLERVASHGFIVIAPQMYEAGGLPLGKPSAPQEAASALALWQALPAALPAALPPAVDAELSRLGLVGHSRGAKVTWLNLVADPTLALAAVGLDPVDSAGTFLASEPRAIPEAGLSFSLPSLFIGTGLGPRGGGAFTPAVRASRGRLHELLRRGQGAGLSDRGHRIRPLGHARG